MYRDITPANPKAAKRYRGALRNPQTKKSLFINNKRKSYKIDLWTIISRKPIQILC
jgi:hypothetical protein